MKPPVKQDQVRAQVLRALLRGDYAPGDRLPPEREFARLTGTSRLTVRLVFADLERRGVIERHQGRGTFIATRARGNRERAGEVALLTAIRDPFALEFIAALEEALTAAGMLLVLKITEDDPAREEAAAVDLAARGLRNLVVWPSGRGHAAATFERLRILGVNLVFFDRLRPGPYADFVGLDNAHAVKTMLSRAQADGAREFLFLSHEGLDVDSDREREAAFLSLCASARLAHRLDRVAWRGETDAALRRRAREWGADSRRLAVLCVNDPLALRIRAVADPAARVYGIDGLPEAKAANIPTYAQPFAAMARTAIRLLERQREDGADWTARQVRHRGALVCP